MPITAVSTYFKARIQSTQLWLGFPVLGSQGPLSQGWSWWRWEEAGLFLRVPWFAWMLGELRGRWSHPREGTAGEAPLGAVGRWLPLR